MSMHTSNNRYSNHSSECRPLLQAAMEAQRFQSVSSALYESMQQMPNDGNNTEALLSRQIQIFGMVKLLHFNALLDTRCFTDFSAL